MGITNKGEDKFQAATMKFVRSVQRYSLLHRKVKENIRRELNIQSFKEEIKENKDSW